MNILLSDVANLLKGVLIGEDQAVLTVETDSRTIKPGSLFFALKGKRDGHAFAQAALDRGAVGVVVERDAIEQYGTPQKAILVEDTQDALRTLAGWWRDQFHLPIIAVTGSNGKTTVKEMIACILKCAVSDAAYATPGNFNNEIGVPLSLFGLRSCHQYAVIEMGMNHPGEIRQLASIVKPTIALINNAQREHMAHFDSLGEIAAANAEVFEFTDPNGTAVLNADDEFYDFWADFNIQRKIVRFGLHSTADFWATYEPHRQGMTLQLHTPLGETPVNLAIRGLHNVKNALAAVACCGSAGISLEDIVSGLEAFQSVKGRLQFLTSKEGATIIDDTYNANPDSALAAIEVLASQSGQKLLVMGDMGEVGIQGLSFHAEIGKEASLANIDYLLTIGELSIEATRYFSGKSQHFSDKNALIESIKEYLSTETSVLVKGSRFMKMEEVVSALVAERV